MPSLEESLGQDLRMRIMIYGPAKTKKTWWAGTAAEAGFNVLLLDGEQGGGILKQLSAPARNRIYRIDTQDVAGRAVFAEFLTFFCKFTNFNWDETTKRFATGKPTENQIVLNREKLLTRNTVLVVDSYSALVLSLVQRYSIEQNIDLSDASKTEWEGYRWAGALASWMIQSLVQLPCHVILIGHQEMYEKRKDKVVEWSRLQMKSVSGPHAMTIANKFDDVLYTSVAGSSFYIDSRAEKDRDGGARYVPPNRYKWEDLSIKKLCELGGIALPPSDLPTMAQLIAEAKQEALTKTTSIPSANNIGPKITAGNAGNLELKPNLIGGAPKIDLSTLGKKAL